MRTESAMAMDTSLCWGNGCDDFSSEAQSAEARPTGRRAKRAPAERRRSLPA